MSEILIYQESYANFIVDTSSFNEEEELTVLSELNDIFSYYGKNYQYAEEYKNGNWDGKTYLFNVRTRRLPNGLYKRLQLYSKLRGYGFGYHSDSPLKPQISLPRNVSLDFLSRYNFTSKNVSIGHRKYQLEAIKNILSKKQSLLISPTASGKSFIIYSLVRYFLDHEDDSILIVTPTINLRTQMLSDFFDYSESDTTIDIDEITYAIDKNNSAKSIPKNKRIIITTWQSVYKLDVEWFNRFGMVIGDEAHSFESNSLSMIMNKSRYAHYRFGCTGTISKESKINPLKLESHFGDFQKVINTKELIDNGTLSSLNILVLNLVYNQDNCKHISKNKNYQKEIAFITKNDKRNNFIKNLALVQNGNTLLLFTLVEKQGKPLYNLIKNYISNNDIKRNVYYVSGEISGEERETIRNQIETETDAIIVASYGVFSTGINIRNLHNLIFASPNKSRIRVLQSIGRILRKGTDGRNQSTLYDITDNLQYGKSPNILLRHSIERKRIYDEEKFPYKSYNIPLE